MDSHQVVLGLLASPGEVESAVNNLTEEGVSQRAISVVLANQADARAIIDDSGPLRGATLDTVAGKLTALGLPASDAGEITAALSRGQGLIAVSSHGPLQEAVLETLQSYHAQHITTVQKGD